MNCFTFVTFVENFCHGKQKLVGLSQKCIELETPLDFEIKKNKTREKQQNIGELKWKNVFFAIFGLCM